MKNKKTLPYKLAQINFAALLAMIVLSITTNLLDIETNIDTGNVWALGLGWILMIIFFLSLIVGGIIAIVKLFSPEEKQKQFARKSLFVLGLSLILLFIVAS